MNILIVGGAGYIGGAITDILQNTNHRTRVYDSLIYEESYRKPADFVFGDVRDIETLRRILGYSEISTTQIYMTLTNIEVANGMRSFQEFIQSYLLIQA